MTPGYVYTPPEQLQTLEDAMDVLLVSEMQAIERHYGRTLESGRLSGTDITAATVWAMERRRYLGQPTLRPDWDDIEQLTMKQAGEYFAKPAPEVDPADPDTPAGKDDSLAG